MERVGIGGLLMLAVGMFCTAPAVIAEVQMKGREGEARLSNRISRAKSRHSMRSHLILDFPEAPSAETAQRLAVRGMRVVAYLPLTGVIVGFEGEANLKGLGLAGFDALQPEDKLSRELALASIGEGRRGARRAYYVVEFHADVAWEDRRALLREAGLEIRDHRDLAGDHMLVRGTLEQVRSLAEWEEIAYIFPASGELATGLPLVGCLGGATAAGQVGQLTQRVGEGWDGPGLNRADLTYSLQGLTMKLPEAQVLAEIQRAMAVWARVVRVSFQRTTSTAAPRNINILFGARDHGDGYPFDGQGRVLAHTFYPAPPNPEPIAGDLHFDNDEAWNVGSDIDLYSVALHELGHALGLGHSDVPNAVMYPYYRRTDALTPEDIGAIQMLYASVPEDEGAGVAPLLLTVSTPGQNAATAEGTINASGTLNGAVGTPSLQWATDQGASGIGVTASDGRGGFEWQVLAVPLAIGDNQISLTVSDAAGRTSTRTVPVQRIASPTPATPGLPVPPPVPAPTPTPNPPVRPELTLGVTAPGTDTVSARNPISAYGLVAGGTGGLSVRWASDRGFSGTAVVTPNADGTYRWGVDPLALQSGANTITVTATDATGQTASGSFRATFNAPQETGPKTDDTPPRLTILSPNTTFLMTPVYSISVRGTAVDAAKVVEVRWECSCGSQGLAQGTSQWTIPNIALPAGPSIIKVTAKDSSGNEGTAGFTVFRYDN